VLDELAQHRLDGGVLALPVDAHGVVALELFEEPFLLLVPEGNALARKARVREADLAGERVLLLDEGHCLREQALSICAAARRGAAEDGADRATGGADFRATSIETLRHMVSAGMGSTLVPALALEGAPTPGAVALPFVPPAPSRRMALCWRRTHPRAGDLRALGELVRAHLPASLVAVAREPARSARR
jgi:LysR family hydrogen peroxide-inducible transcriptional activator